MTEPTSAKRPEPAAATPRGRGACSSRGERLGIALFLIIALVFGVVLESRTALRRVPMTDLGVFTTAAWAVRSGQDLYSIQDFHGWHYQYPPAFAILFMPFASAAPDPRLEPPPGSPRSDAQTPWGYRVEHGKRFYGLHGANLRFFIIVAAWYLISVLLFLVSAHAIGCALEVAPFWPLPSLPNRGPKWWARRGLPLILCIGSVGTELSRGQVDVVMLAAVALAIYLASRQRDVAGGVALAFPAALKLFPPLVLFYPIWKRNWRMAAGVVAGILLFMAVVPAVALGPRRAVQQYQRWIEVLAKPALGAGTDTSRLHELTGMNSTDNQSLLAFIHNWTYHYLPRKQRPLEPSTGARWTVLAAGCVALIGFAFGSGWGRDDKGVRLILSVGILVAMGLLFNPIVHHFYYLLLVPLLGGLVHICLSDPWRRALITLLAGFAVVDLVCRFPDIGPMLRDAGVPILSVVALILMGILHVRPALRKTNFSPGG